MDKELCEGLETRKRIMGVVRKKPGIHFRKILRETGLVHGELEYHLHILVKMEVLTEKKNSYYTRYYPADELGQKDKVVMELLRQEKLREILLFIITDAPLKHGEIAKKFHLLKSTTSFYMKKLVSNGVVERKKEGKNVYYDIPEPERVLRLILLYRDGFASRIVNMVEGLWGNMGGQI